MEPLHLKDIAAALHTECPVDEVVTDICTDTRKITPGCLFVALKGDRFDGHDFVPQALQQGAAAALASQPCSGRVLLVEDTHKALLDLAAWYRGRFDIKVAAVTGSVGKTTSKEMIWLALGARYRTLKNQGNLNNEIGMPMTIFGLDSACQAAVLEMGMNHPGEIRRLTLCARPDVALINNIGVAHIENLGSRENILKAKMEIVEGLRPGGTLVLNNNNDLLGKLCPQGVKTVRFGTKNQQVEVFGKEIVSSPAGEAFQIVYQGREYPVNLPAVGLHNVENALGAFAVAVTLGVEPSAACEAFREYQPTGMRQKIVQKGSVTVIEDCYNANPDSMAASVGTLASLGEGRRTVAVLGDMLELGDYAHSAHYALGELVRKSGVDALFCTGALGEVIVQGAKMGEWYKDKKQLAHRLAGAIKPGDVVLFKASRGIALEEVLFELYNGWDEK